MLTFFIGDEKLRTFYIFNVNREINVLTKDSPYILFKSLETIYKSGKQNIDMAYNLYCQITSKFNKSMLNQTIITNFRENQFYMYVSNNHKYYNKYRDETCNLSVKNSYLVCVCNNANLKLLSALKNNYNLFVCDFENKDYFWLNEIYC